MYQGQDELYSTGTVCIMSVEDKVRKEMTQQKHQLYDTIGYHDASYPKEVALFGLRFVIIILIIPVNVMAREIVV